MTDMLSGRDFLKSDRWPEWRELESDQKRGVAPAAAEASSLGRPAV